MLKIYEIPEEFRALEAMLVEMDEEEMTLNMDAIKDLMDGLNQQLDRKLEATAFVVKNLEGEYNAIKSERERLQTREKALDNRIRGLKSYALTMLEVNGLQSITGEKLKVRWQNNSAPSVTLKDMKVVPIEYLREVTKANDGVFTIGEDCYRLDGDRILKIDGKAVGQHYKDYGITVPGTEVVLGKHIRIS